MIVVEIFKLVIEYFFDLNTSSFVNDPTKKNFFGCTTASVGSVPSTEWCSEAHVGHGPLVENG